MSEAKLEHLCVVRSYVRYHAGNGTKAPKVTHGHQVLGVFGDNHKQNIKTYYDDDY